MPDLAILFPPRRLSVLLSIDPVDMRELMHIGGRYWELDVS